MDFTGPLREALLAADFTYDRVAEAIGEDAHRALGRNETLPALRRTTSGGPLHTLVRLFLLQTPVARDDADRALPGLVDRLCNAGLLEQSVSEVAARMCALTGATRLRDIGVDRAALGECAAAAAERPELDLTPPRADRAELMALYEGAW